MNLRLDDIAKAVQGRLVGNGQGRIDYADIDSRRMRAENGMFAALRGENADGHSFLGNLAGQIGGALVAKSWFDGTTPAERPEIAYVVVDDVEQALWQLAAHVRLQYAGPVLGTTGSVGKSTVKNMLDSILTCGLGEGRSTPGNWNNLLGVPLTILGLNPTHAFLNAELGSNAHGEIPKLATLVRPGLAVITAVRGSHLEGFGDLEGVLEEKASLGMAVGQRGAVVIPSADKRLMSVRGKFPGKVYTAGTRPDDYVRLDGVTPGAQVSGRFTCEGETVEITLPMPGVFNLHNAALAFAVGNLMGIDSVDIKQGLETVKMPAMRMEVRISASRTFILDCYNASADSSKAALDVLAALDAPAKVAFLGAMYELGADSDRLHGETARYGLSKGIEIVTVGEEARAYATDVEAPLVHLSDHAQAARWIRENTAQGTVVLLKGSRKAAMERIFDLFEHGDN